MGRIVVVGGINMDIHLFGLRESGGQAPLLAESHLAQPGGKGANVARALGRLGADVVLVARVGDDEFGRDSVAAVEADGVDVGGVTKTSDAPTGFVAIELRQGKHRSLVFSPGANLRLMWPDIEPHVENLGPDDLVIAQGEIPTAALATLCDRAKSNRVPLFLDPTPPEQIHRSFLMASDAITPDLAEAAQLTGRVDGSRLWPVLAARELVAAGARRVIVKVGAAGALIAEPDGVVQIPTLPVDVLDETGAGDVFMAALAFWRMQGADWVTATRFANAASALSVSRVGLALPVRSEVIGAAEDISDEPSNVFDS